MSYCTISSQINVQDFKYLKFFIKIYLSVHAVQLSIMKVAVASNFQLAAIVVENNNTWVRCTINRFHSTPCKKAEFECLQFFPGHCLDLFLSVSGKICHSPIKKVKRQPTLIISFSQHSPFFGEQSKNPG